MSRGLRLTGTWIRFSSVYRIGWFEWNRSKFKLVRVIDIEVHGIFEWMGRIYTITKPYDEEYCWAKCIAAGWTNNPDSRWQVADRTAQEQNFNPYCEVLEFKYVPRTL